MTNTATRSLRSTLLRALLIPVAFVTPVAASVVLVDVVGISTVVEVEPADPADLGPTRVERLLAANECDLPAGVIPGHAVVTLPGQASRVVAGDVGFDVWLGPDEIAGTGDERPGVIHGFCK